MKRTRQMWYWLDVCKQLWLYYRVFGSVCPSGGRCTLICFLGLRALHSPFKRLSRVGKGIANETTVLPQCYCFSNTKSEGENWILLNLCDWKQACKLYKVPVLHGRLWIMLVLFVALAVIGLWKSREKVDLFPCFLSLPPYSAVSLFLLPVIKLLLHKKCEL